MGKNGRTSLTSDRRQKIEARLREFSAEQLKRAIDGVLLSDWHMGRHEKTRGRPCNDFQTIFRNAQQVSKFIGIAEQGGHLAESRSDWSAYAKRQKEEQQRWEQQRPG